MSDERMQVLPNIHGLVSVTFQTDDGLTRTHEFAPGHAKIFLEAFPEGQVHSTEAVADLVGEFCRVLREQLGDKK